MDDKNKLDLANDIILDLWEQFAYEFEKNNEKILSDYGLSALESGRIYLLGEKIINKNGNPIIRKNVNKLWKIYYKEHENVRCHNCGDYINLALNESIWYKNNHQYCYKCNFSEKNFCSKCGREYNNIECFSIQCIMNRNKKQTFK